MNNFLYIILLNVIIISAYAQSEMTEKDFLVIDNHIKINSDYIKKNDIKNDSLTLILKNDYKSEIILDIMNNVARLGFSKIYLTDFYNPDIKYEYFFPIKDNNYIHPWMDAYSPYNKKYNLYNINIFFDKVCINGDVYNSFEFKKWLTSVSKDKNNVLLVRFSNNSTYKNMCNFLHISSSCNFNRFQFSTIKNEYEPTNCEPDAGSPTAPQ